MTFGILKRWSQTWVRKALPALREEQGGRPWGLTPDQVAALRILVSTPQWKTYCDLLASVAETHLRELCQPLDDRNTMFTRGALYAIRRCALMPEEIATHEDQRKAHDRTRRDADIDARDRESGIFVSTPFYTEYTADPGRLAGRPERARVGGGEDGG